MEKERREITDIRHLLLTLLITKLRQHIHIRLGIGGEVAVSLLGRDHGGDDGAVADGEAAGVLFVGDGPVVAFGGEGGA